MRLPPPRVRRALLPVSLAFVVVLAAGWLAAAAVGLLAAPFSRRRRLLRVSLLAVAYCGMEVAVLAGAAAVWLRRPRVGGWRIGDEEAWLAANEALLRGGLSWVLASARRCVGLAVVVADSPEPAELTASQPVLVLGRHAGPGDSFAVVDLLLRRYGRRVRVVVKEILALDPALDVVLLRLGCCYLPRGGGEALAADLGPVAASLRGREALLVFPEGGNWTPARRRRAIRHLRSRGQSEAARAAALMTHVLPARPGGVSAVMAARPDLPVVVVAHAGLDHIAGVRQAWAAIPFAVPVTVRAWPAASPVPTSEEGRRGWLAAEWAVVDEWVDAQRSAPPIAG